MPRRATSKIQLLAEALVEARKVAERLDTIDLRQTSGPQRDEIKRARQIAAEQLRTLEAVVLGDEPPTIGTRR